MALQNFESLCSTSLHVHKLFVLTMLLSVSGLPEAKPCTLWLAESTAWCDDSHWSSTAKPQRQTHCLPATARRMSRIPQDHDITYQLHRVHLNSRQKSSVVHTTCFHAIPFQYSCRGLQCCVWGCLGYIGQS